MDFLRLQIIACCINLLVIVVGGVEYYPECVSNALWLEIKHACPSAELKQMCSSFLTRAPTNITTIEETTTRISQTYLTPHKTKTLKRTSTVRRAKITTIATPTKTLTFTKADKTVTRSACKPTITCGAATITNSFGPLIDACSCVYVTTTTLTEHITRTGNFPVEYTATTTSFYTSHTTPQTVHPIVTTKVPTLTAYRCSAAPPPATKCDNSQMQVAYYDYPLPSHSTKSINLTEYKTITPYNVIDSISFHVFGYYYDPDYPGYCPGQYRNARGYVYAPQTGFYNWSLAAASNAAWLWIDDYAYSGWNKSNSFLSVTDAPFGNGPWGVIHWEAGTYHPFRFAWFCKTTTYDLYYHLRSPDGHILSGQYSPGTGNVANGNDLGYASPYGSYDAEAHLIDLDHNIESEYVVQFGCGEDANLAPPFPPFGQET